MTFLNPYFLFGLFAVTIPILLHLFNLQKVRKMEFSTLMFLKEIQKSKLRKIRLKQILLLIIRICIIVFLVLAFSNPVYKGYFSGNNPDIRKCGIFILDNSFSMGIKDDKGSSYEQAKNTIKNILTLYNSNDRIFLITSSHLKSFEKGELKDVQSLLDSIKNLELSTIRFDMQHMVNYTNEIIINNSSPLYEVFFLSDNQKNNYIPNNFDQRLLKDISADIHFYNIDIGKRTANNISIEKVEIKSKIPEINKDIKVLVVLKNHNKFNCLSKQVNLFIDDKKAYETVTDIASLERKEVILTFKPSKTGSISGYAELLQSDYFEDEVIQDNKYYFSVFIPEKINAGLVGDNEAVFRYIRLAAESAEKLNNAGDKIYSLNYFPVINEQAVKSEMLIISGKNNFKESETEILTDYIKKGGAVFVFPSKNISIESYNSLLSRINSFRIENISRNAGDSGIVSKFDKIDFEHPLFYGAFKNDELSVTGNSYVESPKVNLYFKILTGNNSNLLMTLPGGDAFLAETKAGEGRLIFCSVSADEDMSDFPRKSLFPLIVNKSILYLGNGEFKNENNTAGRNNIVTLGKNKIFSVPYSEKYNEPGIYKLYDSVSKQELFFAINRDSLESDFAKADLKDVKEFYSKNKISNIEYIQNADEVNPEIVKAREGRELWKILAMLALVFVIIEMLYAKKLERT